MQATQQTAATLVSSPHEFESELAKRVYESEHLKSTFKNTAFNELDIDSEERNFIRKVKGANFSRVIPTSVDNPRVLALSESALRELDWSSELIESDELAPDVLAGNLLLAGSQPIAHCYCGHQFGYFAGQLGDGRAITLGDIMNSKGELQELQLKGSGLTPFSRQADGRAVLRSSIREFLCSEAMHALRIPTTRAASIVVSDSVVLRDPLYDGNAIYEPCAVVLRVAPTFLRFGSFEIWKENDRFTGESGPSVGMKDQMLPKLLSYTAKNHFREIYRNFKDDQVQLGLELFKEINKRTAELVAQWQCVGFCHGVLNTDNMSILGLTIDYGPFGWMDYHNEDHICNNSDKDRGRYAYNKQPQVCKWNLDKLAEAWSPLVPYEKTREIIDMEYDQIFSKTYFSIMRNKLGLFAPHEKDQSLISSLFSVMNKTGSDFTLTFTTLIDFHAANKEEILERLIKITESKSSRERRFKPQFGKVELERIQLIMKEKPELFSQLGVDKEGLVKELMKDEEYRKIQEAKEEDLESSKKDQWGQWLALYSERLENQTESYEERRKLMIKSNPKYVLRNYLAEEAIKKAEKGDYSMVNDLLRVLQNPFVEKGEEQYMKVVPEWACKLCVSCSS